MVEEIKLSAILGVLNNYLDRYKSEFTVKHLNILKTEIIGLKERMDSIKNFEEFDLASNNFYESIIKLEPLAFLANISENKFRGGDLPEPQDEIKIKIINYCVMLQDKIDLISKDL